MIRRSEWAGVVNETIKKYLSENPGLVAAANRKLKERFEKEKSVSERENPEEEVESFPVVVNSLGVFIPASAYVVKSKHPECLPDMLYRAILPNGTVRHFPTEAKALASILEAIAVPVGLASECVAKAIEERTTISS